MQTQQLKIRGSSCVFKGHFLTPFSPLTLSPLNPVLFTASTSLSLSHYYSLIFSKTTFTMDRAQFTPIPPNPGITCDPLSSQPSRYWKALFSCNNRRTTAADFSRYLCLDIWLDLFPRVYWLFCDSGCLTLSHDRFHSMNCKQYPFTHKAKQSMLFNY